MSMLSEWIVSIAGAAMLGVVVQAIAPKGGAVTRVLKLACALCIVITVLRPIIGWNGEIDFENPLEAYISEDLQNNGQDMLGDIIAEQTSAYIVNKAELLGLSITVRVTCKTKEYYPEPYSVTIRSRAPEHARSALGKMITEDLGIPAERQKYLLSGG